MKRKKVERFLDEVVNRIAGPIGCAGRSGKVWDHDPDFLGWDVPRDGEREVYGEIGEIGYGATLLCDDKSVKIITDMGDSQEKLYAKFDWPDCKCKEKHFIDKVAIAMLEAIMASSVDASED